MPETPATKSRAKDSVANTLLVAVVLSLAASLLVAGTALFLQPMQARNEELYRQRIVLEVAGLYTPGDDIATQFANVDMRIVDLESGRYSTAVDAAGFDAVAAAKDVALGLDIPPQFDLANIHRRARFAPVYLVRDGEAVSQLILPVYGSGLWSTMYGFLAIDPDGTTIRGLRFYEHAETPGLGDRIDAPSWRAIWIGKQLFDDRGEVRIGVIRGAVDEESAAAVYQVDGISGATLTGRGVTNLIRYWTGPHGFGPFLQRLRDEGNADD